MKKYEQLIEHIINDNEQAARELFHAIVVEKSREIYESLMDEDQVDENIDQYDQAGNMVDEISDNVEQDETNGLGEDEEELGDIELDGGDDDMGADDMGADDMGDMGADDMGGDDVEGQFQNIKDAIEDLEAEFAKLTGGDSGEEEAGDDFGGDEEAGEEEAGEEMFEATGSGKSGSGASGSGKAGSGKSGSGKAGSGKSGSGKAMSEAELMREYVEKISAPANTEGGTVGTGSSDKANVNKGSVVAGKNDMGGSASNIATGKSDAGDVDGTSPKGKAGGFVKPAQEIDVAKRNVNKVGGNKGAQDFYNTKASAKTGEGQTTDGSVSVNKQSLEGGKK